jgi:16S rRNA (guanine527-N7)-methyltransferase
MMNVTSMEYLDSGAKKLGLLLSSVQIEQFYTYYQELIAWNKKINLTSITDFREVQIRHFLDSLSVTLAFKQPIIGADLHLIDIGAGGGFPGLPLKIALPAIKMVLLEATAKKAAFLHHIAQRLNLDNVEILVGRAEEIAHNPQYREQFNMVLSRAVAPLATLIELTLPFCNIGGSLIAQKKGAIFLEVSRATKAIEIIGGSRPRVKGIKLAELADDRYLIIIDKIAPTPDKYPRRPGIPAKRPIG